MIPTRLVAGRRASQCALCAREQPNKEPELFGTAEKTKPNFLPGEGNIEFLLSTPRSTSCRKHRLPSQPTAGMILHRAALRFDREGCLGRLFLGTPDGRWMGAVAKTHQQIIIRTAPSAPSRGILEVGAAMLVELPRTPFFFSCCGCGRAAIGCPGSMVLLSLSRTFIDKNNPCAAEREPGGADQESCCVIGRER